ncbi:hypothetical protein B0T22DRAFT_5014 [Podospora appendiculata]|uniref:Uncharacterized protein n=1 Tax=Podospora appendiculata TaxID=314037 RepID=A0AAE0XF57_9PEZI|nr:hypothetical protein B0T22DRAFT_5014 [Podospora appendiculata]
MAPILSTSMPPLAEKTEIPHSCGGLKKSTSKRYSIASAIRRKGSLLLNLSIRLKRHKNDENIYPRHTEAEKDGSWYHTTDRYITPYGSEGSSRSSSHQRKQLFWTISGTRSKRSSEETVWEPDELASTPALDNSVSGHSLSKTKSITRSFVQSLRRISIRQRMPIQVEEGEPGNPLPTKETKQALPVLAVSPTDDSSVVDRRSSFWLGVQKAVQDSVDENFCLHEHSEMPVATTRVATTEIYYPKRSRGKKTSSQVTKTLELTHAPALVWPGDCKDVYELEAREVCTKQSSEIATRSCKPDQNKIRDYWGFILHISRHLKRSNRSQVCMMRERRIDKFLDSSREISRNTSGDFQAHRVKKQMQLLQSQKIVASKVLNTRRKPAKLRKRTLVALAMNSVVPIVFPPNTDEKQTKSRAALELPRDDRELGDDNAVPAICAARSNILELPGNIPEQPCESPSPRVSDGVSNVVLREMHSFGLTDAFITPPTNNITLFRTPDLSEESAVTVDDEHSAGCRNTRSPDSVSEKRDTPIHDMTRCPLPPPKASQPCVDGQSHAYDPDTYPAQSYITDDDECQTRSRAHDRAHHSSVDEFVYGDREPL